MMKRAAALPIALLMLAWFVRLQGLPLRATQADEGVHIAVAEWVSADRMRIYADLFENRTPAVEWLLAAWFRLVGPNLYAARVLTVGVTLLTAALLLAAVRLALSSPLGHGMAGTVAGSLAVALFLFAPLSIFWSHFVMLEHFSNAAAAASVAITIAGNRRNSPALWFAAGLLGGLAVAFKQTEVVLPVAILVFFGLKLFGERLPAVATLRSALVWIAGMALAGALLVIVLALQGSLAAFIQFASSAAQPAPFANLAGKANQIVTWSVRRPYPWLLIPATGYVAWRGNAAQRLLLLWFLAEAGFLLLPSELDLTPGGFSHYAIPALASASAVCAAGIFSFWRRSRNDQVRRRSRMLVAVGVTGALILVAAPWFTDAISAAADLSYPQASVQQEAQIGRAAALLAAPDESILVFGNAIFYHRAQRMPASRYFHWPDYLAQSSLEHDAVSGILPTLQGALPGAVLVSRLHLQERLPRQIQDALWQGWTPVALFPYAYQRDVLLFARRSPAPSVPAPLADFGEQVELSAVGAMRLDAQNLLVRLWWRADARPRADYTVFVHLLSSASELVAQDDSVPVVGFRPTTTWPEDEAVLDYHWLQIPEGLSLENLTLSVGLYEAATGERLPVTAGQADEDAYRQPLRLTR